MELSESRRNDSFHLQGCIDIRGQEIPHGYYFAPGPDECLICTCSNGVAILCRTVLCAPPHDCHSLRVGDSCCEWICLDKIRPFDDNNEDMNINGSADIGLRLFVSAVTAILSITLLFFLIYRLRQRKIRRRQHEDNNIPMEALPTTTNSSSERSEGGGNGGGVRFFSAASWFKPDVYETRSAPPSYDDAVRCFNYPSDSVDAPPYSEIHQDPIVPEPDWSAAAQQQQQQQQQQPVIRYLPTGAALVMPVVVPASHQLHHVEPRTEVSRGQDEAPALNRFSLNVTSSTSSSSTLTAMSPGRRPSSASSPDQY